MMSQRDGVQLKLHCLTIEDLVPQDEYLRKVEAVIDWNFIYAEVWDLYSHNNGRPSIDPVVLVKYVLLGYLEGISSERQIERQIRLNNAYRWFLGLELDDAVPDHSTISQNRRRRFNEEDIFRKLFERVLRQCIEQGLVEGRIILTDSSHVKANASKKSEVRIQVEKETAAYFKRLDAYEAAERARLEEEDKLPQKKESKKKPPLSKMVEQRVSTTDPDAGFLHRTGKPQGMHYLSHQSVDAANGIVVDVAVTSGNVNDAMPYLERVEYMKERIGLSIEAVGVDSGYDISIIHQALTEQGIDVYVPASRKSGVHSQMEFDRTAFRYDEEFDLFICPHNKQLRLKKLERNPGNIYRYYEADLKDCKMCPLREKCVPPKHSKRRILVNIFEAAVQKSREKAGTPQHKHILALRQIWCEGCFAIQKAMHNLRRLTRRGQEAAEDHCLLSATALNLKRMVRCLG